MKNIFTFLLKRVTACSVILIMSFSLIAHSSAANYQATVIKLSPTYYYELNETTTENGAPLDTMGNAPKKKKKNGEYNGFYGEGGPVLGVKVHFTCLVQMIQME